MTLYENNSEIQVLQEYLRIPSIHPHIDYEPILVFLKRLASEMDLPCNVYYPSDRTKPIVIITWTGCMPELPSIMLNSHMDVESVMEEKWTYPPFTATLDENGNIFARGIQNAKGCGMQYLAAIKELKKNGCEIQRTAHITFMPDEKIGSRDGMKTFLLTNNFKKLNVGFCLDEGVPSPFEACPVFYAERNKFQTTFKIYGPSTDPSDLPKNTAAEKFSILLNKLYNYRKQEMHRLNASSEVLLGDVNTINLTKVEIVEDSFKLPSIIEAHFDIRLSINVEPHNFAKQLRQWCLEAGDDIDVLFHERPISGLSTALDTSNPFWVAFMRACKEENVNLLPMICPEATDMRFLREMGIPALGFSPMPNTPTLYHGHNEYLNAKTYLRGIAIYKKLIPALLNVATVEEDYKHLV